MTNQQPNERSSSNTIALLSNAEIIQYQNIRHLTLSIMIICLSSCYFGWVIVNLSAIPRIIISDVYGEFAVQKVAYGVLQGCVPAGAIIGALISPSIMKLFSRNILIFVVLQIANIWVLLVARVFQGIFAGNYLAIVPIYINDLSPRQIVGAFGGFTNLFIGLSMVFCFAIQVLFNHINLNPEIFWRLIWSLNSVFIIFQSILFIVGIVPQSPNSLIMDGRIEEARQIISLYNKQEFVQKILKLKIQQYKSKVEQKDQQNNSKTSWRAYLVAFSLSLMYQLVGIGTVTAQIGNIISTFDLTLSIYLPLIVNFVQLIASFLAVYLLSKIGRKTLTLIGNGCLGIINLSLGVLFIYVDDSSSVILAITVLLTLYKFVFGLTLGAVVWLYVPEIIPARNVPIANMHNWIAATAVFTLTPVIVQSFNGNPFVLFFIFAGITFAFFIQNSLLMEQTKGLTREQIAQKYLKNVWNND